MAAGRPGRRPTPLPPPYARVLVDYAAHLARADMTDQARRTYLSRVRMFLAWLAGADVDGDPLTDPDAAVWAARDYKAYLYGTRKRAPATVNAALAAVSDLALRRGLGKLDGQAVARLDLPARRPGCLAGRPAALARRRGHHRAVPQPRRHPAVGTRRRRDHRRHRRCRRHRGRRHSTRPAPQLRHRPDPRRHRPGHRCRAPRSCLARLDPDLHPAHRGRPRQRHSPAHRRPLTTPGPAGPRTGPHGSRTPSHLANRCFCAANYGEAMEQGGLTGRARP